MSEALAHAHTQLLSGVHNVLVLMFMSELPSTMYVQCRYTIEGEVPVFGCACTLVVCMY